jgi:hypothetical protein
MCVSGTNYNFPVSFFIWIWILVFWAVTLFSPVGGYQCFEQYIIFERKATT